MCQDDGVGLHQEQLRNGNGMGIQINGARYRAEQIGASFHVGTADDGGTIVTCSLANNIRIGEHQAGANLNGCDNSDRG